MLQSKYHNSRRVVERVLEVREGDTTGKYLNLPSLIGRNKREILGFLKEKILGRIRSWNAKSLSRVGREVLLKNVIQAMPSFAMMVFLLPGSLCDEVEMLMNAYWWTGAVSTRGGVKWRNYEGLCAPNSTGGMGFRKLKDMNISLLRKQVWRLLTNPNSLVACVYKARYYPSNSFLDAKMGSNPSYIWSNIFEAKGVVREGCKRVIGDGTNTTITYFPWLLDVTNPYVQTDHHPSITDAPVSTLFDMQQEGWDK